MIAYTTGGSQGFVICWTSMGCMIFFFLLSHRLATVKHLETLLSLVYCVHSAAATSTTVYFRIVCCCVGPPPLELSRYRSDD